MSYVYNPRTGAFEDADMFEDGKRVERPETKFIPSGIKAGAIAVSPPPPRR